MLCLKCYWTAHSIRYLRFSPTFTVQDELQAFCTVKPRSWIILIAKDVEEKFSDPAIFKFINVNGQRGSGNLASLIRFELAERQVFASRKLKFFQLRPPPQPPLFYLAHGALLIGKSVFSNPHQEVLYGKFRRVVLSLGLGGIK